MRAAARNPLSRSRTGGSLVDPSLVHGKRVAIVARGERPDGSPDVAVFTGVGRWGGTGLVIVRETESQSFPVPEEFLDRLQPVPDKLKPILLEADYFFTVTVGNLEEGADLSEYQKTGLVWPGAGDASDAKEE